MTQRINYSQANNSGKMLAQAINSMILNLDEFKRVAGMLDSMSAGGDWAAVAGELGISQQEASDLWFIVAAIRDKINSANAGDMAGALSQLSRLDQG